MNKTILGYIEECEAWKVAIKNLHWSASNLSQHELCDDIASSISDFEDLVSEVEQSINGKIKLNGFTPKSYEIKSLKTFVEDVISSSKSFLNELEKMGENYVGIKSECETFIGDMQRKLYLVNFTLKEEMKERIRNKINESMPKNLANHDEVDKFIGRRPKTMKARINQIYRIVKKYGIDSKIYHDDHWQAKDDYYRAITSLGCDFEMRPCGNSNNLDNWDDITSDGGYCDYAEDGMPRSKQYAVKIMYDDGMNIGGYIKFMAAGRVDDPFSSYDTCMVLWPKNNRVIESKGINEPIKLTESELKQVVKEAAVKVIKEWGFPDEGFGDDYNTPYGDIDDPRADYPIGKEGDVEFSWDEDAYDHDETPLRMKNHHDEMDRLAARRDRDSYWNDTELRNRNRMMDKYIKGERDADDIGDAWDDIHYESKKPMKVTESELKEVIKEAAIKLIKEYGDTPNGQYALGKLQARQRFRDNDTHKAARTNYYAGFNAPEDERKYKQWAKAGAAGYEDGKKEFNVEESSDIEIKPSKKGTFTAAASKHGKSVQGFASQVLNNKEDYSPAMVKKANFARNSKKWNKK